MAIRLCGKPRTAHTTGRSIVRTATRRSDPRRRGESPRLHWSVFRTNQSHLAGRRYLFIAGPLSRVSLGGRIPVLWLLSHLYYDPT